MRDATHVIIGAGIAGTTLAWAVRFAGGVPLLVGDGKPGASRVAAGLVTPVTGQRLALSWRLEELYPAAVAFYDHVSAELGVPVFARRGLARLFADEAERRRYATKAAEFNDWTTPLAGLSGEWFDAAFGGCAMPAAGQLLVETYLDRSHARFAADGQFVAASVDPAGVVPSADGVEVSSLGVRAERLTFCQGVSGLGNPWFPAVPFNPTKGEILTLEAAGWPESRIVNRGVWAVPVGDGVIRAGATYDRGTLDATPTVAGREQILERLRAFVRKPLRVVGHDAGVRPVVFAHRPVVERHGTYPRLGIINGLGSKGTLLAPWFATHFLNG